MKNLAHKLRKYAQGAEHLQQTKNRIEDTLIGHAQKGSYHMELDLQAHAEIYKLLADWLESEGLVCQRDGVYARDKTIHVSWEMTQDN